MFYSFCYCANYNSRKKHFFFYLSISTSFSFILFLSNCMSLFNFYISYLPYFRIRFWISRKADSHCSILSSIYDCSLSTISFDRLYSACRETMQLINILLNASICYPKYEWLDFCLLMFSRCILMLLICLLYACWLVIVNEI